MSNCALDKKLFLDEDLAYLLQQKIQRIDAFNFHWDKCFPARSQALLKELKALSTISSVGSSTRIEGASLSDEEIKTLIANMAITQLKSRDEEEVLGYFEVINLIHESYEAINLSEAYIKQLHSMLLQFSSKDTRHRGEYKALSNKVVAQYPDGTSRVIFNTTEPYLTAKEMNELVDWTNIKLKDSNHHKLLVIAIFVYEFLSIHPFQDGNGRLSRLLVNLLLLRAGYGFVQYISLERIVEERKKAYYESLMMGQKNRYSDTEDLTLLLGFFMDTIEVAIDRLEQRIAFAKNLEINDRQNLILDLIKLNGSARMSKIKESFSNVPKSTLNLDLKILAERNLIQRNGRGRGTWYTAY